jgi:hypothetical protein
MMAVKSCIKIKMESNETESESLGVMFAENKRNVPRHEDIAQFDRCVRVSLIIPVIIPQVTSIPRILTVHRK